MYQVKAHDVRAFVASKVFQLGFKTTVISLLLEVTTPSHNFI